MSLEKFTNEDKMWIRSLVKEMAKHDKPSQETCERLDRLENALFGDPNDPDDKGMQPMIKEMYKLFTGTRFASKGIMYFFGGIGVIVGGIYAFIKILRDLAH